ncbi:protein O3 [Cercopithecine betaherpesvirus 5]|uniref:Protein O3 n=1 Tax=Simian cytomegalovirus (strain Colburn) TaxID=50292 RepID=G8XT68_SCMVC|nr:protein O3 [Cercopithecine betaherpesvirus 5]AEV80360.1 protein O3 [Cercopithecine betaherpesvirus 5]AEV80544.1 protein O3 [Cercopithecine betaherpesvirus 5]
MSQNGTCIYDDDLIDGGAMSVLVFILVLLSIILEIQCIVHFCRQGRLYRCCCPHHIPRIHTEASYPLS